MRKESLFMQGPPTMTPSGIAGLMRIIHTHIPVRDRTTRRFAMAVFLSLLALLSIRGQEAMPSIEVSPLCSKPAYAPGDTVIIALQTAIPKGYHFFDNPMGPGFGKPMTWSMKGQQGIVWLDLLKQKSKKFKPEVGGWVKGFEGEPCFFIRGLVSDNAPSGVVRDTLLIGGLICREACHPVDKKVVITVMIGAEPDQPSHFSKEPRLAKLLAKTRISQAPEQPAQTADTASPGLTEIALLPLDSSPAAGTESYSWDYTPQETGSDLSLLLAILFGFIAGIILNAMPCVLPVLGVKILSFSQGAGMDRKKAILHSLVFSAGIISVFLLLAGLASFANLSWGQQFQDPRALVGIISLIVIFSLGMFDVYLITVPGGSSGKKQTGLSGHLFSGIFATVLATPCSGPFLGAVLAWSVTQPASVIFTVYASIGMGMSFPYVLFSASKRLMRLIPRPGAWMNDFKKIMGFLLLGFAVYLMLGLPADFVVPTVLFCVLISLGVVLYSRIAPWGSSIGRRLAAGIVTLFLAGGSLYVSFGIVYPSFSESNASIIAEHDNVWQKFDADLLVTAHKQGRPAIVDFTANWCMNCQYNYIAVLTRKQVMDLIRRKNVLALKVDMTAPDPVQDSLLHRLGSQSIPFLALFPGDKPYEPVVMRDVLTVGKVKKALEGLR
jgi:thiol:disulfide interchange protein